MTIKCECPGCEAFAFGFFIWRSELGGSANLCAVHAKEHLFIDGQPREGIQALPPIFRLPNTPPPEFPE